MGCTFTVECSLLGGVFAVPRLLRGFGGGGGGGETRERGSEGEGVRVSSYGDVGDVRREATSGDLQGREWVRQGRAQGGQSKIGRGLIRLSLLFPRWLEYFSLFLFPLCCLSCWSLQY